MILCISYAKTQDTAIKTFEGHTYTVASVAFSPNKKTIASASWDKTIKLWNIETGELIRTFYGHLFAVFSVNFSPDGNFLVSASKDNTLRIWNTKTGELIYTFAGHSSWVNYACFSPDGKYIASAGWDSDIILWDVKSRKSVKKLQGHTKAVLSLCFSSDGQFLASSSRDGSVKLWQTTTGEILKTFKGHTRPVWSVDISTDGNFIASGSQDMTLKEWDVQTGELIWSVNQPAGWVNCVKFTPEGRFIISSSFERFSMWRAGSGKFTRFFKEDAGPVYSIDISNDGNYLVSSYKQSARLWNLASSLGPEVKWIFPRETVYTSPSDEIALSAVFQSDTLINDFSLYLNDSLCYSEQNKIFRKPPQGLHNFAQKVNIRPGENSVKLIAENDEGYTKIERKIIYPLLKPTVTISEKRLAVVIGNINYNTINKLSVFSGNVETMSDSLRELGFWVLKYTDVLQNDLEKIIENINEKYVQYFDISLFYYTGYIKSAENKKYILPVDYQDKPLKNITEPGINISNLVANNQANHMKIVIIDATEVNGSELKNNFAFISSLPANTLSVINYQSGNFKNNTFTPLFSMLLKQKDTSLQKIIQQLREEMYENKQFIPVEINTLTRSVYINKSDGK